MVKISVFSNNQNYNKYIINMRNLYNNRLTLRYKNYSRIPKYTMIEISDTLVGIILEIIYENKLNYQLIQKLELKELELFEMMLKDSGYYITLKYDKTKSRDNVNELSQRYKVLIGEINAGNDNVLEEMQQLSYELYKVGKINRTQLIENLNNSL